MSVTAAHCVGRLQSLNTRAAISTSIVTRNPVFGWLLEAYGWGGVLHGVAGLCALAAPSWLFTDCTQRLVED